MTTRVPVPGSYWIHPGLLAGPYPRETRQEVSALVALGTTLFIDLTEAGELPPYSAALPGGVDHRRMAIRDFTVPTRAEMEAILQALREAVDRQVYLHCRGGLGRTGTVVGCLLVDRGLTGDQALAEITRLRLAQGCDPGSPETEAQRSMVRSWKPGP